MTIINIYVILSAAVVLLLSLPFFNYTYCTKWNPLSVSPVADLIVKNGVLFTSDDSLPFAESMALQNGRILRVGNYSFVKALAGYRTKEFDVGGKVVVPGFIDSHVHMVPGGLQMMQVELRGVNEKNEFIRRVQEVAKNSKQGSWILGGGWNDGLWGGSLPDLSWIDDVTPHNPVWLSRMDGHMGLANSVALKLAGITKSSDDPKGGKIMRNKEGGLSLTVENVLKLAMYSGNLYLVDPSGLIIESAMELVASQIPEPTVDERREAFLLASNYSLMRGVTTVVDVGRYLPGARVDVSWDDFSDVYQWAYYLGKMKVRVCLFFPMETWSRLADHISKMGRTISQWIYLGGVKAFFDGSLGSNSALLYEPYIGEPHNYGLQVMDSESLFNMTLASDLAGIQVAIHAIGDKANDMVLDMYASVASRNGVRDRRFRIEHAQHLASGTPARFGNDGIIASMQPDHLLDDAVSAARKLGSDRAEKGSYLCNSLLSANALLAFGSDWPVADINPLSGIKTAVKRLPPAKQSAWIPTECITVTDALKAYTINAAHACFLEKHLGSLSPGKLADFVVLSANSWERFTMEASASVEATFVSGKLAYP